MTDKTVSTFAPPCAMPNGLQWTDQGLFVIDQYSDRGYLMDEEGFVTRSFETPTSNGSGIAVVICGRRRTVAILGASRTIPILM